VTEKQFTNALESYESLREIPGVGDDEDILGQVDQAYAATQTSANFDAAQKAQEKADKGSHKVEEKEAKAAEKAKAKKDAAAAKQAEKDAKAKAKEEKERAKEEAKAAKAEQKAAAAAAKKDAAAAAADDDAEAEDDDDEPIAVSKKRKNASMKPAKVFREGNRKSSRKDAIAAEEADAPCSPAAA
jgi:colicin import membrane protein|tara:strand:- start:914 stop:1471 length:558 start_codon:yes stop_codon:yes gene_type:complete